MKQSRRNLLKTSAVVGVAAGFPAIRSKPIPAPNRWSTPSGVPADESGKEHGKSGMDLA